MRSVLHIRATGRPGPFRVVAAAAVVAAVALIGGMVLAAPASASTTPQLTIPSGGLKLGAATTYPAGTYIVQLRSAPAATYTGGVGGYARTMPRTGGRLDAHSSTVESYTKHLAAAQKTLLGRYGVRALHTYTVAYNGFAAKLTSAQATRLGADKGVLRMTRDRILTLQDDALTSKSSLNYLKVAATGSDAGVWGALGGHANAGAGVVVGEIDTGIAPDNPSFAGSTLPTSDPGAGGGPWLNTSTRVITYSSTNGKARGTFTSTEEPDPISTDASDPEQGWSAADYSTKIIAAHFYDGGWSADGGTFASTEKKSPLDTDDHGSHTASTAAGDYGVDATVDGVDYGTISGVAPAAKIAVYKACWSSANPNDDGCDEADLVAAIEQATADGVDVINFSIGGGPAQTIYSPTDQAFLAAAAAGIFVSAAGGNAGPGASTLDNASPWETTVAASTIPSYEATVELGDGKKFAGASITVPGVVAAGSPSGAPISGASLVLATSVAAAGVSASHAIDCRTGSLSHSKTVGRVVVCDRDGKVDRVEMSATVKTAGGIGAILVNTSPEDVDLDQHSVPTIHVDEPARATIRAYAAKKGATVSFAPENEVSSTPVPQIAAFSSRGPVKAGGEDTLKPDIAAPGVSILAAYADAAGEPQWGFDSGTSMATPHIAGLAALYLGDHPAATPAEIKSALMTSATNAEDTHGKPVTNPFAQGAGEANPSGFLSPGLVYLADKADWDSYVNGTGEAQLTGDGVTTIDPSDLNQASIAIGALAGKQTVTRTVTARTAGTYTASISGLAGITATVSPDQFTIASGDTQQFTVTFARTSAAIRKFVTGSLTWTNGSLTVRSPIAVQPTTVPPAATGSGTNGYTTVTTSLGSSGTTSLHAYGLAPQVVWPGTYDSAGGSHHSATHFATASTHEPDGTSDLNNAAIFSEYISNSTYTRFEATPASPVDDATDLDLYVLYHKTYSSDLNRYSQVASSATSNAAESVGLSNPPTGYYVVVIDPYTLPPDGADYSESMYNVTKTGGSGHFVTSIPSIHSTKTGTQSYRAGWGGLSTSTSYLGVIRYGSGTGKTLVSVDTGSPATAPIAVTQPVIAGTVEPGHTLTTTAGAWNVSSKYLGVTYQWYEDSDSSPIAGATGASHSLTGADFDHNIYVKVTSSLLGAPTTATSSQHLVRTTSKTSFAFAHSTISHVTAAVLTVAVSPAIASPTDGGVLTVKYGSKTFTSAVTLAGGTATINDFPVLKKGSYPVRVTFNGVPLVVGSTSSSHTLKVT